MFHKINLSFENKISDKCPDSIDGSEEKISRHSFRAGLGLNRSKRTKATGNFKRSQSRWRHSV